MTKLSVLLICVLALTAPCYAATDIVISVAGDFTLGYDETRGYGNSFLNEYNIQKSYSYFLEKVRHIFESDDLTIVNLEGPLTNAKYRADKEFGFKGLPEFVNILSEGSIEAVNLANNHTMDYGKEGYDETVKNLEEAGIEYFGNSKDVMYKVEDVTVGVLGYKSWNADKAVKNQITCDIDGLRQQGADIIVVSFHWGVELQNIAGKAQKEIAQYTVDAGADLVFGHHPHVIQGIETYKGKSIVYSLGNFCYGGSRNPADKDSFIFQQLFSLEQGEIISSSSLVVPVSISSVKNRNNFQPTPLYGTEADRVLKRIAAYSK